MEEAVVERDTARRASEAAMSAKVEAEAQRDAAMSEAGYTQRSAAMSEAGGYTGKTSATPANDQPETNELDTNDDGLVDAVEEGTITAEMKTDGPPIPAVDEAELYASS